MESFEIKPVGNGVFHVFLNSRCLDVQIINGAEYTGKASKANIYGIYFTVTKKVVWCGSLENAKKSLLRTDSKLIANTPKIAKYL